ncbi:MAG TPA: glutamate--cysteine ligase [Coriobacteriia bacterium]|nr:glutamate--cysteine ligase [Coriobacteriia bacterium]
MPSFDGLRFGLEHEFAVVDAAGRFRDFTNTTFEELDPLVAELPIFPEDYPQLRVGDLGIKRKRWYIEGFERYSADGRYLRTDPKGFEIRTPICGSLEEALAVLDGDIARWREVASRHGFRSVRTSLNPFQRAYEPHPPLNAWEVAHRQTPEERSAHIHMLTYGPDISFSHPGLSTSWAVDAGMKLTYYSPYVVPFSFTSPFFAGELWGGHSRRTYHRTGPRPSVLVHVGAESERVPSDPTLTDLARLPAEVGRIEFKAFDCPPDTSLYAALGTLLAGIALDDTLPGRALVPDAALHRLSATEAFENAEIHRGALGVLLAARAALPPSRRALLEPLEEMAETRTTPAHAMVDAYRATGDIIATIEEREPVRQGPVAQGDGR